MNKPKLRFQTFKSGHIPIGNKNQEKLLPTGFQDNTQANTTGNDSEAGGQKPLLPTGFNPKNEE